MSIQTISERENPLLGRKECWVSLEHAGQPTPAREKILDALASHLKAEKEAVIIDKIFPEKGKSASRIKVLVYADRGKIPKEKLQRMRKGKKEKKAEAEGGGEKEGKAEGKAEPTQEGGK